MTDRTQSLRRGPGSWKGRWISLSHWIVTLLVSFIAWISEPYNRARRYIHESWLSRVTAWRSRKKRGHPGGSGWAEGLLGSGWMPFSIHSVCCNRFRACKNRFTATKVCRVQPRPFSPQFSFPRASQIQAEASCCASPASSDSP